MVLGDLLDLELKQKWAPKHSLFQFQTANLAQKTAPSTYILQTEHKVVKTDCV